MLLRSKVSVPAGDRIRSFPFRLHSIKGSASTIPYPLVHVTVIWVSVVKPYHFHIDLSLTDKSKMSDFQNPHWPVFMKLCNRAGKLMETNVWLCWQIIYSIKKSQEKPVMRTQVIAHTYFIPTFSLCQAWVKWCIRICKSYSVWYCHHLWLNMKKERIR